MKPKLYILIFSLSVGAGVFAQKNTATIITDLGTTKAGQGKVRVYEDEAISGLIGSKLTVDEPKNSPNQGGNSHNAASVGSNSNTNRNSNNETGAKTNLTEPPVSEITPKTNSHTSYIQTKGYKIQVFSGNDQRKSRQEAETKKELVESAYPDMEVVISFNSPVWKVRAGNFRTYEQAFQSLKEMKSTFPDFGKELQIVEAIVKLPVN
jgi:hypothetical protein